MITRTFKRLIAKISIVAVLLTQLAVAAYACPTPAGPANIFAGSMADDMHADMPGCEMDNTGNPNLCSQHCQAGDQSVQTLPYVGVPAFAAISFAVIEPVQLNAKAGIPVSTNLPERETSPPPLLRFGFLRI